MDINCSRYFDSIGINGSPMWPEYKFTWWDKLRFKWITGYEYEEVK